MKVKRYVLLTVLLSWVDLVSVPHAGNGWTGRERFQVRRRQSDRLCHHQHVISSLSDGAERLDT